MKISENDHLKILSNLLRNNINEKFKQLTKNENSEGIYFESCTMITSNNDKLS